MDRDGFTLIELLIVISVIGLLAMVALPSYRQYVYAGKRSDAMNTLMQIQMAQEKYRANHPGYAASLADIGFSGVSFQGYYSISLTPSTPPVSYSASATPTGKQAGDTTCSLFVLNQDGPDMANTPNASICWKK